MVPSPSSPPTAAPVGLVCKNSPAFVRQAFEFLSAGIPYVLLRDPSDQSRLDIVKTSRIQPVEAGHGWFKPELSAIFSGSLAQVAFTSGTEGRPKGIALSAENLADTTARLCEVMQLTSDVREYIGVPVYYSFGFGRCRAIAAVGGQAYIPPKGFDIDELGQMLARGEVNALSAVPSLLRLLLGTGGLAPEAARRLRWLEIGSQYMSAQEKEQLKALFPNARMVQHYGLTEASRTTFLVLNEAHGEELESVGKPNGRAEVRITDAGRIAIRGPHTADFMLTADGRSSLQEQGWLITNDLGRIVDGFLYYEGRADDVINWAGIKLPPEALEERVRQLEPEARDFALARISDPLRGDGLLLAVAESCPIPAERLLEAIALGTAEYGAQVRGAVRVLRVIALPQTGTGKIQRKELAQLYAAEKSETKTMVAPGGQPPGGLDELKALLGVTSITATDTFSTLGGDSLSYIQATRLLQRQGIFIPDDWENKPLASLFEPSSAVAKSDGLHEVEAMVAARALAIIAVVVNHSGILTGTAEIAGGAFFLLIAAGFSFSRFQLSRVFAEDRALPALSIVPRIAIPTVLFLLVMHARKGFFWPAIFLYSNFLGPDVGNGISFWFIEAFIQIHLLAFVFLSIAPLRRALQRSPYPVSLGFLGLSLLAALLGPMVWNTEPLWDRVPHMKLWYFALGMCLYFGRSGRARWVNTAIVAALALSRIPVSSVSQALWVMVGGLALWMPRFRVPAVSIKPIRLLASASLMIYITHFTTLGIVGGRGASKGVQIVAALIVGVVAWFAWEKATAAFFHLLVKGTKREKGVDLPGSPGEADSLTAAEVTDDQSSSTLGRPNPSRIQLTTAAPVKRSSQG